MHASYKYLEILKRDVHSTATTPEWGWAPVFIPPAWPHSSHSNAHPGYSILTDQYKIQTGHWMRTSECTGWSVKYPSSPSTLVTTIKMQTHADVNKTWQHVSTSNPSKPTWTTNETKWKQNGGQGKDVKWHDMKWMWNRMKQTWTNNQNKSNSDSNSRIMARRIRPILKQTSQVYLNLLLKN